MKSYAVVCAVFLAVPLAGQDVRGAERLPASGAEGIRPPVLQDDEVPDSLIVTLPGTATPKPAPAPAPSPAPSTPDPSSDDDHRPLLRRAPKPVLPAEFERESAVFTQKMIGSWTQPDAYNLYGDPLR